ncbi:MAG: hypothetical protein CMH56_13380 [Myxococcales bacterium]|nr:hypothetical protein [Myxococcales bacterium]
MKLRQLYVVLMVSVLGACPDTGQGSFEPEGPGGSSGVICPRNSTLAADNNCYCDTGYTLSEDGTMCVLNGDQVGLSCTYSGDASENPSNKCPTGLACFIVTRDGAYGSGLSKPFWEDQFTHYHESGVDEGFCTFMGTWNAPPSCPSGTVLKLFEPDVAACVRTCETSVQCPRSDDVCDIRFLDVQDFQTGAAIPHCVRPCELDIPDCVRTAVLQRGDLNNAIAMHVWADDITGASVCNATTGLCSDNPGPGEGGLGERCFSASDCIEGTSCWQGPLLGLAEGQPGFCGGVCKPNSQQPESGCPAGHVCQAGFTFGHGDPLDANTQDTNGFLTAGAGGTYGEAGGFCFIRCTDAVGCGTDPDIQCGQAETAVFAQPWNSVSMCLQSSLRAGD